MIRNILTFLLLGLMTPFNGDLFSQELYDLDKIQEVKITIDEPHWDNKLNAYKKQNLSKRLIGSVKVNGVQYDSVGIRYKGNSSYFNIRKTDSNKLPFNIKIDYIKKDQRLPGNFKTLKLSNVFRDPSFLREALSYEIAGQYMAASRANYAHVYVNEDYLGFYNLTESVDKQFLRTHFGDDDGVLFKCDPAWKASKVEGCAVNEKATLKYLGADSSCYKNSYELKSDHGWNALVQFTKDLKDKRNQDLESIMNVDAMLWMLAFDISLVNLDSYLGRLCHNYYIYQDSMGRFNPIIWDMNMSFGGFRFGGTGKSLSDTELQKISPLLHFKSQNKNRPLILHLFENPLYRKIYLAHLRTINNENFVNGRYKEKAKEIRKIIDSAVKNDTNKLYSYEGFVDNFEKQAMASTSKIVGLSYLMDTRSQYLKNHPLLRKTPPSISNVKHESTEEEITITAQLGNTEKVWLYYRSENMIFKSTPMTREEATYTATIPNQPNTQYYILAENKEAAMLSPERAAYEFYSVE